jgi:hypothetical protein
MPLARLNGTIFFFVHVPKCGGTSIKRFLEAHGSVALDGRGGQDDWSRCTVDHVHAEIYDRLVPAEFYDHGFIIFRDPVERLKSEFRMFARPAFRSWNPVNWVLAGFARLRGRPVYAYRFLYLRWLVDPDLWVRGALWISRLMPYRGNNHYRPQAAFWREGLTPFFLDEGLEKVTGWIAETAGLPEPRDPPPREAPRLRQAATGPRIGDVPFSPATEAFIRRFYAEDYALIGRLRAAGDRP